MTQVSKIYRKQFDNKKDAQRYYDALQRRNNLYGRTMCYLVQEHCYEVTSQYTRKENA